MMNKKYSIGLDIGTNSVGWAVVDENNQLVKKNGFTLWGVRMFKESESAANRRSYRTNRRRLTRRKERIKLLRNEFNAEINKIDPTFFERLDESFYKLEDRQNVKCNNLFSNSYTDSEFYKKFPTIFHLRKYLMETKEKVDIRFIYLALHHIIKYRGNFLYNGDSFSISNKETIKNFFVSLNDVLSEYANKMEEYADYFEMINYDSNLIDEFSNIMLNKLNKLEKKKQLLELFKVGKKTLINECIIPLLINHNLDFSKNKILNDDKQEECKISLESETFDMDIENKEIMFPKFNQLFKFVKDIKEVVDYYYLNNLLGKSKSLSEAMCNRYSEHEKDLGNLKAFIKTYVSGSYKECFKINDEKINNYPRYVGMTSVNKKTIRFGHCSREEFYKYIRKIISQAETNDPTKQENLEKMKQEFLDKIDNDCFLLRQNSNQNGSIPMQLNLLEMEKILKNQQKHYDFLNQKDESGYTVSEKIILIFKYKIPYYVGPLNVKSKNSWLVRNNNEKIYPWNFDKIVNIDETATKFIQRMQNKCTYLKGENDYCLPKQSIIYSKYNCLSYLNKININGSLIDKKTKMDIFENVFLVNKKPTKKDIYDYLRTNYGTTLISESLLKDLSEVNCNMSSYIKFKEIFNHSLEENLDFYEQIIKDITIFEDKTILEKRLEKIYKLDKDVVKKLKDLNYKGYGNLCYELLYGLPIVNSITGEQFKNVMHIMEETNYNLQEILYNPDYRLIDIIDNYNNKNVLSAEDETVEDFLNRYSLTSPIMKRPLIQAYNIIKEVRKILNQPIDKYYIECTRTNKAEKKQTKSRHDLILELYDNCKKIDFGLDIKFNVLRDQLEKHKNSLKSDSLYLYFTQLGRCMYSLNPIDLDKLVESNHIYDIDHIYPQSLIPDNSMSNRVLVFKDKNEAKANNMLFEKSNFLHPDAFKFYQKLYEYNLISKEKYLRLTKKELSQGELETFVNRQLVATNQAVKGLIQVLKYFDKVNPSNIIYSKAENISAARQEFDWPKSRLANNFHHAHDAYLNVVIGRVIDTYFTSNHFYGIKDYYRFKAENLTTNIKKILEKNRYVNKKCYWNKDEMIKIINYNLYDRYDISETKKTYNDDNLLSKVEIKPKGKGTVPLKQKGPRSKIEEYGGITSYKYYKYMLIETNSKKNKEYILEAIPTAFLNNEKLYLNSLGYKDYNIILDNVKSNCVVEYEDKKYYISSKTGDKYNITNAKDRYFNKYLIKIIKKIEKYNDNLSKKIEMDSSENKNKIILSHSKKKKNEISITLEEMNALFKEIIKKYRLKIFSYSAIKLDKLNDKIIEEFDVTKLIELNNELLKLLQTNVTNAVNLNVIGLSSNSWKITANKKLKPGMKLIAESVTGYYRKVLFEVPSNVI